MHTSGKQYRIGIYGRIDRKWDARAAIYANIGERLPGLKRTTRRTNELLVGLRQRK